PREFARAWVALDNDTVDSVAQEALSKGEIGILLLTCHWLDEPMERRTYEFQSSHPSTRARAIAVRALVRRAASRDSHSAPAQEPHRDRRGRGAHPKGFARPGLHPRTAQVMA